MAEQQNSVTFPLWTCINTYGRQFIAMDADGIPDFPVWETREQCMDAAPPGMAIVPLDEDTFVERLRQFAGDSQISFYLANGRRYRMPVQRMLDGFLPTESG